MAADIGVKMSVSGVNQFKSSMNQAKSSVKALDAELKLNSAQFKATGDAETYMANRTKILSDQIKSQEEVVANAAKALETMAAQGVDKASTAYTQMQAALAKAKTDLLTMQQAAQNAGDALEGVGESGSQTANSLKSIDSGIKFQNISSVLDKVDNKLKNILTSAVNIGKSIWNWGVEASDWADTLSTNATKYGLDVETLQRYKYAAERIDTSVEDIVKAQDKLLASTKSAEDGVALITHGESQFGVELKNAEGQARDMIDVFWDFIEILGKVENETDRNAIAQEYFGKSYRELLSLIEKGRDEWEAAAEAADVVTEDNVNKLTEFNDKWQETLQKWESTKMTLLANLAPAFEKIADALQHMMDLLGDWAESPEGQKAISNMGEAVAGMITRFANTDFEALFDKATGAVEKVANFFSTLTSEETYNGLKALVGLFAGIKVSTTALKFANILSNMGGGGAAAGGAASAASGGAGTAGAGAAGAGAASGIGGFFSAVLPAAALAALNYGIDKALIDELYDNPGNGTVSKIRNWFADKAKKSGSKQDEAFVDMVDETYKLLTGENIEVAATDRGTGTSAYVVDFYGAAGQKKPKKNKTTEPAEEAGADLVQSVADGIDANLDKVTQSSVDLGEGVIEGLTENVAAAYNAGAQLGAAFVAGAASAAGGYRTSEINNFENINAVNVYGATNPAEILAAYRQEMQKNIAGYGG